MTQRTRPLNRRACETIDVCHEGHAVALTASRRGDGTILEMFLSSPKTGTGIAAVAHDAAIVISIALQSCTTVADLLHSIKRNADGNPSSLIGTALDALARLEMGAGNGGGGQ